MSDLSDERYPYHGVAVNDDRLRAIRIACDLDHHGQPSLAEIVVLCDELLRRREAERWRPIETAPKDGTQILGCAISAPEYDPSVTAFVNDEWQTSDLDDGQYVPATWTEAISHWRPLPTPPEAT